MPSFGVLFEPACSSAGRRPGRCVDDLVLAVNEVPAIGGMDDGAVQESAVKLRTGRVTPPASAGAEVQLEPDHPSLRASQGPPTDWPARPTVPARDRRAPPGRALSAAGW
jgi:hypothetical protein